MTDPKFEKPSTVMHKQEFKNQMNEIKRLQLLNENLRLGHVVEGADNIRLICKEDVEIFKLPGHYNSYNSSRTHNSNPHHPQR